MKKLSTKKFKSILLFCKHNCKYSNKVKKFLEENTERLVCVYSKKINEKININKIIKYKYDYIFCFRSYYILRNSFLKKIKSVKINFHPGLPQYRGRGSVNFALYNKEKYFGCTAHIIDSEKIDSGPIINVKKFCINDQPNIDAVLKKTYSVMTSQAIYLISYLLNQKSLSLLIKNNLCFKWSKKLYTTLDLENLYKLKLGLNKLEFKRIVKSTYSENYKPYIIYHGEKFIMN
jgi:methionyl-tRNA formyltransferase